MQKIFDLCIKSFNELAKANQLKATKIKRKKVKLVCLIQIKVKNIRIRVGVTHLYSYHFMFLYDCPVSKQVIMETEEK